MKSPFKIKICGCNQPIDGANAIEAGADAIGLNFYQRSLRSVPVGLGRDLAEQWRTIRHDICLVGVFVNAEADAIKHIASQCNLNFIQLHGNETTELVRDLEVSQVIRAIRIRDNDFQSASEEIRTWQKAGVKHFLVDAAVGSSFGGTGSCLEWSEVAKLKEKLVGTLTLAGGLKPENVRKAIISAHPDAVDVASGVEGLPAKKSADLIREFVSQAQSAFDTVARMDSSSA